MKQKIIETRIVELCDICICRTSLDNQCAMCRKYLCRECRVCDDRDCSDYPPLFCKKCWDIGTSYRKAEDEAQEVYHIALEDIWLKWKEKATKDLTD